jgi:tRNA(Arg) A34 adenosine deaminase TadA
MTVADASLFERLFDVIENDIVPLTAAGVAAGNKLFGAAILRKADLSLIVAGTNQETENPLWHGEISALNAFYRLPAGDRPIGANITAALPWRVDFVVVGEGRRRVAGGAARL